MTSPADVFPDFYHNSAIQELSDKPRWTVSDIDKMPIDIRELKDHNRLRGAFEKTTTCLMDLHELVDFLPNAANNAFALNAPLDRFMVLDIEKECPPDVARELLAIPALYTELSMSGLGYHLLMPMPTNFEDFPLAMTKLKLREEHGWYEVLLDHWVTFTRRPIPASHFDSLAPTRSWDQVFADLAQAATEVHIDNTIKQTVTAQRPQIPGEAAAHELMTRQGVMRTPADFHGDNSRYEFSVLGILLSRLTPAIPFLEAEFDTEYTAAMKAWLVYEAATEVIPHRAKHDELRNGMPLLLSAATDLLARRAAEADEKKKTKKQ